MKNVWIFGALGALALAACDNGSSGRVNGTVQSALENSAPSEDARVALLWITEEGNVVADSAPVTGDFPASFSLDITAAPPAGAIQSEGDVRGASGMIAVVEGDTGDVDALELLGMSDDLVLFLEEAIGAELGAELGVGEVAAGYHLVRFSEDEETLAALDECYDAHAETLASCEDACFADLEPATEGCEDEACFDERFDAEAECFQGCWGDDPCEDLAREAYGMEILPIDTPTEVSLFEEFEELDDEFDDELDEEAEACLEPYWESIDGCYAGCESDQRNDDVYLECEALFEDPEVGDEEIEACFENASANDPVGQCYTGCDGLMQDAFLSCGIEYDC